MTDKTKAFVMPGAEPDDIDLAKGDKLDLSFMAETDEEKEARELAEARKADRQKEADEAKAEADRVAAEKKAALEAEEKGDKQEEKKEDTSDEDKLAAELAAKKDDKGKKQPMVPKSRLDEVLQKNKLLQAEIEAEKAAKASRAPVVDKDAKAVDVDALEDAYMDAVMAGEKAKARELRTQIRAEEQKAFLKQTDATSSQDTEIIALAKAAKSIEENFPQFVRGHEKFNEAATNLVIKMRDGLIASGTNAVEALNEAVEFAVTKYKLDEALEDNTNVVDLEAKRKEDATKKKIDAQKKQPPDLKTEGNREKPAAKNEIDEMSDEDFAALPESAKRRLRGDFI